MYNRLLSFLKKHNALTNVQHGFIENKSTETASHSFRESVQEALDSYLQVVGIFLDLSKAYDIINHNILLDKLDSYGVRHSLNMWFKSYLTNTTQFVEISQTDISNHSWCRYQSSLRATAHGVPQGSILGPLLFLVYMNDLTSNIQEAKLVLYAGDTKYIGLDKNEDVQARLSSVMKQLEVWFLNSDLIVNTNKTVAMSFHLCQLKPLFKPHILLLNTEIAYMYDVKFLGMYITENLSWQSHICSLCHSLSKTYYIIKSLKNILSNHMLWNIYSTYFQLQLRYGIILWGGTKGSINILHILRKVIRFITGIKKS